jgi:AmmeMemoRadiSam system protein B
MAHSAANRLAPPDVVSDPVPVPPDLPESPSARIDKMTHSTSTLRPAAVAGTFYPGTAGVLTRDLRRLLSDALPGQGSHEQRRPKAIIVPHAGYVYSGAIAATVYAPLHALRASIRRVVLLGPTHRVAVAGLAVPSVSAFATPLGEVPLDSEAMRSIARLPQVVVSDAAHAREHSLEVQLPFLQAVLEQFTLVPLAVGDASPSEVAEVLETLWGGDETLIVISSDLSHFLPYARACETDSDTARHIVALDAKLNHQQACGATPVNGLLLAARRHGLRARLLDLRNSGDTAGDKARVVGYGAFSFTAEGADAY